MRKKIEITDTDEIIQNDLTEETDGNAVDTQETGAEAYIVALQAEMEELRAKTDDAEKRVLYTQAEFQNFRRRKEEEFREVQRFATGELLLQLLPIVDSFERASSAAEQTRNFDALVTGLAGTMKQLQSFLQKSGVSVIDCVGKEFDPKYHEAIGHTESDEYPAHTVAEEVQKGYLMQDRVLRPALVKVTEG